MRRGLLLAAAVLVSAGLAVPVAQAAPIVVYGTSDVTDSNLLAGLIVPGFTAVDPDDSKVAYEEYVGVAMSVNMVLFGLMSPFAAALMDRFGIRRVVVDALLLVAFATAPLAAGASS